MRDKSESLELFEIKTVGVDVLSEIRQELFDELRVSRMPALIKNGLRYFPGLESLSPDYVVENYGERSCDYSGDTRPVRNRASTNYEHFFTSVYNENYTFTRRPFSLKEDNPFLRELTFPNPFFAESEIVFLQLFAGRKGAAVLPHSHGAALNLMVYGRKKWILLDAESPEGERLEQYYYDQYRKDVKWMEWYDKEYEKLRERLNVVEFIQEARDIVFVPNNFNHTVYNMEDTIGIVVEL